MKQKKPYNPNTPWRRGPNCATKQAREKYRELYGDEPRRRGRK